MGSMHQLKITLNGVKPPVWRRLLVPSEYTLTQVHEALLTGMGWSGYHLYAFRIGRTTYMDNDDDWPDSVDPSSVRLGELVGPGDRFVYEYDFGDGWEHQVVVEEVAPSCGPVEAGLPGRAAGLPTGGRRRSVGLRRFPQGDRRPEARVPRRATGMDRGSFDPTAFDPAEFDRIFATLAEPAG